MSGLGARRSYHLRGFKAVAASAWCRLVFACAFVIPMLQLVAWFWQRGRFDLDERYSGLIVHTLYLGGIAALITVSVALVLAFANRLSPTRAIRSGISLANVGLCLAGFGAGGVDHVGVQLSGPRTGGAAVRLARRRGQTAAAGQPVGAGAGVSWCVSWRWPTGRWKIAWRASGLRCRKRRVALGVSGPRLFCKVYLPLLLPGTLSAALLVFVDVLKEMPATLLMRPFGWDTLAVRIFEMTSEGEWARASLPALTLVLVGLLPVIGLIRRSARHNRLGASPTA